MGRTLWAFMPERKQCVQRIKDRPAGNNRRIVWIGKRAEFLSEIDMGAFIVQNRRSLHCTPGVNNLVGIQLPKQAHVAHLPLVCPSIRRLQPHPHLRRQGGTPLHCRPTCFLACSCPHFTGRVSGRASQGQMTQSKLISRCL